VSEHRAADFGAPDGEVVPVALDGERLDRVIALIASVSRGQAAKLVADGMVRVNGEVVRKGAHRLARGDRVAVAPVEATVEVAPRPDPTIDVAVVYADADIAVLDKPAGLVVHPGSGNADGTLVNGLLARWPDRANVGDPRRPGIVHRLDKGTSGLLVVARSSMAYAALVAALSDRTVERRYTALVWGHLEPATGMVDAPIGRSGSDPTRMAISATGREARTRYEVIGAYGEPASVSLLECRLETGRTHQIRVHLAAIGHPVVGDARYRGRRAPFVLERPFLHAAQLAFTHPVTGESLSFTAPLPADLQAVLDEIA
jgi:23S rRNA pseudouridine1911/1915/1917 synthase